MFIQYEHEKKQKQKNVHNTDMDKDMDVDMDMKICHSTEIRCPQKSPPPQVKWDINDQGQTGSVVGAVKLIFVFGGNLGKMTCHLSIYCILFPTLCLVYRSLFFMVKDEPICVL
jgi:hypothetical protein